MVKRVREAGGSVTGEEDGSSFERLLSRKGGVGELERKAGHRKDLRFLWEQWPVLSGNHQVFFPEKTQVPF